MLTDPIDALRVLLQKQPALVVHFSGVPKGTGHPLRYPDDLRFALANPSEILCCSTVEPGDLTHRPPQATGSVGIVIDPTDEHGIVLVRHDDKGSPPGTEARRALDRPTSVEDCLRSFIRDGDSPYNEWLVGPYRVVGLFVGPDAQIQKDDGSYHDITVCDVLNDLGNRRIFSCANGAFVERDEQGSWQPLDMPSVYP